MLKRVVLLSIYLKEAASNLAEFLGGFLPFPGRQPEYNPCLYSKTYADKLAKMAPVGAHDTANDLVSHHAVVGRLYAGWIDVG